MGKQIDIIISVFAIVLAACAGQSTDARIRGGVTSGPVPFNPCPNGVLNAAIDGCQEASQYGTYYNPSMNNLIKDNNGNTATLSVIPGHASGVPFNVAGRDFPVGPRTQGVYKDPKDYYFSLTSGTVNGTTFTATTVSTGTVRNDLILWSSPGSSGQITNGPVLSNCFGGVDGSHPSGGGSGTTCTLSISQSNKTGPYKGSPARGCSWADNTPAVSQWSCDWRVPNEGVTSDLSGFEFAAVGGHSATNIRSTANGAWTLIPTLVLRDTHWKVDSSNYRANMISVSAVGSEINLIYEYNECDGGEGAVPIGAPPASFNFPLTTSCLTWTASGSSGDYRTVSYRFNYIHDFSGNPVQISVGYNDIIAQANVFDRIGLNNGNDTAGGQTGLHGATINWNAPSSERGSSGRIRRYNEVAIYPYGFRGGVTTAPFAILGGASAVPTVDYDQQLTTAIMNQNAPGTAISSNWIDFLRVGAISSVKLKNNYVNTNGITNCFSSGGDLQGSGAISGTLTASTGNGWSTWDISGFAGDASLPYPGQVLSSTEGSSATRGTMTLTDLLNGTSRMDVTGTQVGSTTAMAVGSQIVALRMADIKANPTLIVSQSDPDTYIVSNGTGSGETRADQSFRNNGVLQDFGAHGTTATGGSSTANYNGTWAMNGERNVLTPTSNWYANGVYIANSDTIDTDIAGNYDMLTGSALTVGGISLSYGSCPGTGLP